MSRSYEQFRLFVAWNLLKFVFLPISLFSSLFLFFSGLILPMLLLINLSSSVTPGHQWEAWTTTGILTYQPGTISNINRHYTRQIQGGHSCFKIRRVLFGLQHYHTQQSAYRNTIEVDRRIYCYLCRNGENLVRARQTNKHLTSVPFLLSPSHPKGCRSLDPLLWTKPTRLP